MPQHKVCQGEYLSLIALAYGFRDWRKVYDHPRNEALRKERPDPNLLYPGDIVHIPEREARSHACATGQTHRFVFKRPKHELRVKVLGQDGEPLRQQPFLVEGGGEIHEGTTDGEGLVVQPLPMQLDSVTLHVGERQWTLQVGGLNPLEDTADNGISGVQARLLNLGFDPGPVNGVLSEQTRQALCSFEVLHGLSVTGQPQGRTLEKLKDVHGC